MKFFDNGDIITSQSIHHMPYMAISYIIVLLAYLYTKKTNKRWNIKKKRKKILKNEMKMSVNDVWNDKLYFIVFGEINKLYFNVFGEIPR